MVRSSLVICAVSASLLGAPLAAQTAGSIRGRLVERATDHPVPGAEIVLLGTAHTTRSNGDGVFQYEGVTPGTYMMQARAAGYHVTTWEVQLRRGELLLYVFEMDPSSVQFGREDVFVLPGVTVSGEATPRTWLVDFERRRRDATRGVFFTRTDFEERDALNTVTDLLRGVNGVRISCRGGACQLRMSRLNCVPMYYVDGMPAHHATAERTAIYDIAGIEVYRSASETPIDLQRSNLKCGVIAIWTRRGPPPR